MSLGKRLKQVLDDMGLRNSDFCRVTGYSHVNLSNILHEKTSKPSIEILQLIAEHYPDVNLNWLLTGEESMYRDPAKALPQMVAEGKIDYLPAKDQQLLRDHIKTQAELIRVLKQRMAELERRMEDQKE